MVYTTLTLVEGFVVSREEMIEKGVFEEGEDEIEWDNGYFDYPIRVFDYPCCSELNDKTFIVGRAVHTYYRYHTSCFSFKEEKNRVATPYQILREECKNRCLPLMDEEEFEEMAEHMGESWKLRYLKTKWGEVINIGSDVAHDICGPYTVCDECLGTTNNGQYDIVDIFDNVIEVNPDFVCHNCGNDNRIPYTFCKVCNLKRSIRKYEPSYSVKEARKHMKLADKKIAYYYVVDDCLSCT